MNSNFMQVGQMTKCGHCDKNFQAVEPCDCKCHAVPSQVESVAKVNESIDWEKEFKTPQPDSLDELDDILATYYGFTGHKQFDAFRLDIKSFIRSLLEKKEEECEEYYLKNRSSTIQSAVEREREEVIKEVETYIAENRQKVERIDRYVLDDLIAHLKSNLK